MPEASSPLPLRDIIAPLEQGWWPPAPGWWIVTVIFLFFAGWALRALVNYYTYEFAALRKAALRELAELPLQTDLSDSQFAEQVSALLKRVAMVRYAAQQPAQLSGEAWLAFLDQSNSLQSFSETGGGTLLEAQYRASASIDRSKLMAAAGTWIKTI